MLSYGNYQTGTGLGGNPMTFEGGSDASCKKVTVKILCFNLLFECSFTMFQKRSSQLFYECYCDEFDCDDEEPPSYNTTSLWWGEFEPCIYTAYVYTPLACDNFIS